jgi:hypothetical protein
MRNPIDFRQLGGCDGEDVIWDGAFVPVKEWRGVFDHYVKGRHRSRHFGYMGHNCISRYAEMCGVDGRGWERPVMRCSIGGGVIILWEICNNGYVWNMDVETGGG